MKLNTLHTLAAAIALTLLGSCSSDEVVKDSDGNQRIVFSGEHSEKTGGLLFRMSLHRHNVAENTLIQSLADIINGSA